MRGIDIEKTAAVGTKHFYRELRSNRPLCDSLLRSIECFHNIVRLEILHNAL